MQIRVELLGRFGVEVDGRPVAVRDWRRARSVALVKLLALAPGFRLHREQAMDALWPELAPDAAAANLRKAVHYARRAIGTHDIISLDGEMLSLAPRADLQVDAVVFETMAQAALRTGEPLAARRAAEQYGGELLPDDQYAEWSEEPRERLRQLSLSVLRAGHMWEQLLAVEPTDEQAQCTLMQAALDAGNRGEVIRQFRRLRERLRVDLGLGPSAATIALYERALTPAGEEPASVSEHVGALLAWSMVHIGNGDFDSAARSANEARALAMEAGLARELGEASALVGLAAHMQGRWLELFQSEFAAWIRQPPKYLAKIFDGHLCLAEFCLCGAGGHDTVARAANDLLALAEKEGSLEGRALSTLILGEAELFSGRWATAESLLGNADRLHDEVGAEAGRALVLQRLGELALARGQRWRANRLLNQGRRIAESNWLAPHLVIRLQGLAVESASSTAAAMDAIVQGDRLLAGGEVCRPCSMGFRIAASTALAQTGDVDRADRRLEETERLAGMWQGGPWMAAVWEARGAIRLAQGRTEQGAALLHEAAARYGDLGRPAAQARCEARAAELENTRA